MSAAAADRHRPVGVSPEIVIHDQHRSAAREGRPAFLAGPGAPLFVGFDKTDVPEARSKGPESGYTDVGESNLVVVLGVRELRFPSSVPRDLASRLCLREGLCLTAENFDKARVKEFQEAPLRFPSLSGIVGQS
jgi:hypothetical protein